MTDMSSKINGLLNELRKMYDGRFVAHREIFEFKKCLPLDLLNKRKIRKMMERIGKIYLQNSNVRAIICLKE